jgi:V8-like Glu-specific endopeptidase
MPQKRKLIQLPLAGKLFLCLLAIIYSAYLVGLAQFLYPSVSSSPAPTIVEHEENPDPNATLQYWTVSAMNSAIDTDQQNQTASDFAPQSTDINKGSAVQKQGQAPSKSNASYPLSTVGKVFFSNDAGQNMVCSGTAVISNNHSTVDTAGHCLYWAGAWVKNLIFCPVYDKGTTPYGCWAARDLEVPSDWINPAPNDLHHDLGEAIVSANSEGLLTDFVGGAGFAYNQPATQTFYAYGYPAAHPYDGQTLQSCEGSQGTSWKHGGGTVVSIPCPMTGGSSGGPWFIKVGGQLYLDGHNDFTSSIQPGHMFSPYYDDTWSTLYDKAQNS